MRLFPNSLRDCVPDLRARTRGARVLGEILGHGLAHALRGRVLTD